MPDARVLQVASPLGPDAFVLSSFSGTEALSRPFAYELELGSTRHDIAPADVVGKPLGFSVKTGALGERRFHGRVRSLTAGEIGASGLRRYRAQVVPWLWFLTKRSGCRIFQNKKPTQIAEAIFGELGFSDFKNQVKNEPKLEYCVQYRESDFNFLSRLFEEFGIFYYFEHAAEAHTLVLADAKTAYVNCDESKVRFDSGALVESHVSRWERDYEFTSGKWASRDYDFTKSATLLESKVDTVVELPSIDKYEVYEHPGLYTDKGLGESKAKTYVEGEEVGFDVVTADSNCISFRPAGKFTLTGHDSAAENKTWVIVSIRHQGAEPSSGAALGAPAYANSFSCVLATTNFKPARRTPKPVIGGLQTALVVGPAGEEIYTDAHGRIRVQFHWDREGAKDANSSCWIRVAQPWAGKSFGAFHLPRIGQEVVVAFMEGDPDRPLVISSVYNDVQTPPFPLPDNKTQTGIRTRSSMGGGADNCNEIRFEDKKGAEELFVQAEKDKVVNVKNDRTETVGHDETISIVNNRTEDVGVDEKIAIGSNRTESVGADETITIGANRTESVGANETITIGGDRTEQVAKNETVTVAISRTHSVGINDMLNVGAAQEVSVGGLQAVTVGAARETNVGLNDELSVGKKLTIDAGDEITITTGKASISMKKDGTIKISGKDITVTASGAMTIKATKDVTIKGQKILEN